MFPGAKITVGSTLNCPEGRNNTAHSAPQSSGPWGYSNMLGHEWLLRVSDQPEDVDAQEVK